MESIVLIFPHPDDDAFGMGGTALLMKGRYRLYSLCMTKGELGIGLVYSAETAAMREKEQITCSGLLQSDLEFMNRIDGELFADRDICEQVAARLKKINPRAILTTFPFENHPDHAACAETAVKAARIAGIYERVEIYLAEEGSGSQTLSFDPHIFVDITPVIEQKKELIRSHACQNKNDAMCKEAIEQNLFRGRHAQCGYAEAWRSYFPLVNWKSGRNPVPVLLEL